MVTGSSGPFAELAGRRALEIGGTAADAVLTTALAQVVLAAGSWVSFAGIFSLVYYEAAADKVHSLHAGYKTFQEEAAPLTIPGSPTPSGRTALVPGFFAGVEAAHRKFGKLPWKEIFEPAIYAAATGYRRDLFSRGYSSGGRTCWHAHPRDARSFLEEMANYRSRVNDFSNLNWPTLLRL
jgi:gamma-glutamyltranspeptidase/glutathione hydrolase